MGRVFRRIVAIALTSPITLIMIAWVLFVAVTTLMAAVAFAITILWTVVVLVEGVFEWTHLFAVPLSGMLAMACAAITRVSWRATATLCNELAENARQIRDSTREVLTERADRAEAKAQRGGRLSMSVGKGTGGELTQAAYAASGLELVEQGVALDLGGDEARGEAEVAEQAEVVSEVT